jgi:hypothetical protein
MQDKILKDLVALFKKTLVVFGQTAGFLFQQKDIFKQIYPMWVLRGSPNLVVREKFLGDVRYILYYGNY